MAADPVVWADTMFVMSLVLMVVMPPVFWWHREHPLIAARLPVVCVTELLMDLILLAIVSSLFGSVYDNWLPCPCFIANALNAAFGAIVWNVTMSRITVFTRLAQSNSGGQPANKGVMNSLVHWLGRLNAPLEFRRMELRLRYSSATADTMSMTSTLSTVSSSHASTTNIFGSSALTAETLQWFGKMMLWFLFWCVLSLITTYPVDGDILFLDMADSFPDCSVTIFYQIGIHLMAWNALQLGIVYMVSRNVEDDSLGLKTELIVMQSVFSLCWGIDGLFMVIAPEKYAEIGIWFDLSAMLMHAVVTFGYPLVLVYRRKYQEYKLVKSGAGHLKSENDFKKVWSTQVGRAKIIEIARRYYALENTSFLLETEDLRQISWKRYQGFYEKYIEAGSPFELNLPSQLRTGIKASLKAKEVKTELLAKARAHIMTMMFSNFKTELSLDFQQFAAAHNVAPVKSADMNGPPMKAKSGSNPALAGDVVAASLKVGSVLASVKEDSLLATVATTEPVSVAAVEVQLESIKVEVEDQSQLSSPVPGAEEAVLTVPHDAPATNE